ncbi:DUF3054 domain-containing protein [Microlunatus speluncae]|uniref:DUF3054 domain-containing protein n=1 Tax=Microlunatus speluncae TaxID=2594267 RepID=UPI0012666B33|nr:DUF3054 domain-containing protein [Microlunatus speluncae]
MKLPLAFAIDLIIVLVFAIVGRSSHAESIEVVGVGLTAWPFLVGAAVGTLVALLWHRLRPDNQAAAPAALAAGVVVWLCTVIGGIALRLASGDTAETPFVIVATISLGVLLLGWRAGYKLICRARHATAG